MDLAKLNDWMHVLGIFALVASLIFVGLQMKQDHEIALAGQFQERSATAVAFWNGAAKSKYELRRIGNMYSSDPDWAEVFGDADSVEEVGMAYVSARRIFVVMDNHHYQHELGFHNEDAWQMFSGMLRDYLEKNEVAKMLVRIQPHMFRPKFHDLCTQMISEFEAH